jgi:hypothetical protein
MHEHLPMKFTLTLLFIGLFSQMNGQTLREVERLIGLITSPDSVVNDTTGFSELPRLKFLCDDHASKKDSPERKSKWAFYNVLDLNADGRNDLVYSGPCSPYDHTALFLNDGLKLRSIFEYPGRIVSIRQLDDRSIITLFKASCCCDSYSDLVEITVYSDSRVEERWITFFGNTEIKTDNLAKISAKGILRTTPELIDAKTKDPCTDEVMQGNHLKNIPKATNVVQLSAVESWRLILYPEDSKHSWIGWIKLDK